MEFLITKGQNYFTSGKLDHVVPENFLAVDAVFMPVTKVNFFVETSIGASKFGKFEQIAWLIGFEYLHFFQKTNLKFLTPETNSWGDLGTCWG